MEFSFDNIMTGDQAVVENLFTEEESTTTEQSSTTEESQGPATEEAGSTTEEIDENELFKSSESVGGEEETSEKEDTSTEDGGTSSPNFYSSIATALKEDGVLPFSDDVKIETPEDFAKAVEDYLDKRLDEKQQRINAALNAGIKDVEVKNFEKTIDFLNGVSDDDINDESAKGEQLRKNLIYQDFINRGYSDEEAREELKDIMDAGTDKRRAIRALAANKNHFNQAYKDLIEKGTKAEQERKELIKKQSDELKNSMLEKTTAFGFDVDRTTRQKAYDAATKATYKDAESGEFMTEIQKYEHDNPVEFRKNVALLYTMTNGFKDVQSLSKPLVKKEVNKSIKNLESKINTTSRVNDGSMRFTAGVSDDALTYSGFGTKWDLNI